jgi:hypothetical protein
MPPIIAKTRKAAPPKPMIVKLDDGRTAVVLDERVKAAALVTFGDTDSNKKQGIRAIAFADVPFDGEGSPRALLDTGEVSLPPEEALARLEGLMGWLASTLKWMLPR